MPFAISDTTVALQSAGNVTRANGWARWSGLTLAHQEGSGAVDRSCLHVHWCQCPCLYPNPADILCRWPATIGQYDKANTTLSATIGWHEAIVHDDLMHVLFVHGVANWAVGSTLLKLAQGRLFGNSADPATPIDLDGQLKEGFFQFKRWAKQSSLAITAGIWCTSTIHHKTAREFPFIAGKAADARLSVFFLAHLLTEMANERSAEDHPWSPSAASCFAYLATFIHTVASADLLLTPMQAT